MVEFPHRPQSRFRPMKTPRHRYKHSDRSACARAKWLLSELKAMWVTQSRESRKDTTCGVLAEFWAIKHGEKVEKRSTKRAKRRCSSFSQVYPEYWDGRIAETSGYDSTSSDIIIFHMNTALGGKRVNLNFFGPNVEQL